MPAKSAAQQALMAIAEHHPEQVKPENRGVLDMSKKDLHDFASTSTEHLPEHTKKKKSAYGRVRESRRG